MNDHARTILALAESILAAARQAHCNAALAPDMHKRLAYLDSALTEARQ